MMKREDTIQMSVGGLTLDPVTKTPIVILKDTENKLNLPIWIGLLEATAMATEIEGIKMARPMTHDLLKSILGEVGCSVECVEITELGRGRFHWADGSGSELTWQAVGRAADGVIWYATGKVKPGALLPTAPVVVLVQRPLPASSSARARRPTL